MNKNKRLEKALENMHKDPIYDGLRVLRMTTFGPDGEIKPGQMEPFWFQRTLAGVEAVVPKMAGGAYMGVVTITAGGCKPGCFGFLDGQTRGAASALTGRTIDAAILETTTDQQRCRIFVDLNAQRKMSPGVLIRADAGAAGEFFRGLTPDVITVGFVDGGHPGSVAAGTLLRGLLTLCAKTYSGRSDVLCDKFSEVLAEKKMRDRVRHFIEFYGALIRLNSDASRAPVCAALAQVTREHIAAANGRLIRPNVLAMGRLNFAALAGKNRSGGNNTPIAKLVRAISQVWPVASRKAA